MFFVYILRSIKKGNYYVGSTHDLDKRFKEHNAGKTKSTKGLKPLEIVYTESCSTNTDARKRESYIKRRKSRRYIELLIKQRSL